MVNNKKVKTKNYKKTKKQNEPVAIKPHDPYKKRLTSTQLTALIFLSIGASYTFEYMKAKDGDKFLICQKYLNKYGESDSCAGSDNTFITMKSNSASLCMMVTSFTILMCWSSTYLLNRILTCLCISPLALTIPTLISGRDLLHSRQLISMLCMCIVLLGIGTSFRDDGVGPHRQLDISFQNTTLLVVVMLSIWSMFRTMVGGAENLVTLDSETLTKESKFILNFIIIDRATITAILVCILFQFDENRKRSMMLIYSGAIFYYTYYKLPTEMDYLQHADKIEMTMLACGATLGVASLLPAMNIKRKMAHEE